MVDYNPILHSKIDADDTWLRKMKALLILLTSNFCFIHSIIIVIVLSLRAGSDSVLWGLSQCWGGVSLETLTGLAEITGSHAAAGMLMASYLCSLTLLTSSLEVCVCLCARSTHGFCAWNKAGGPTRCSNSSVTLTHMRPKPQNITTPILQNPKPSAVRSSSPDGSWLKLGKSMPAALR